MMRIKFSYIFCSFLINNLPHRYGAHLLSTCTLVSRKPLFTRLKQPLWKSQFKCLNKVHYQATKMLVGSVMKLHIVLDTNPPQTKVSKTVTGTKCIETSNYIHFHRTYRYKQKFNSHMDTVKYNMYNTHQIYMSKLSMKITVCHTIKICLPPHNPVNSDQSAKLK